MNIIQGVAFDLEGTVINIEHIHHKAHLKAAAEHGINITWHDALKSIAHFIGGPDEAVAKEMAALTGKKISAQNILESKRKYFFNLLKKEEKIRPRKGFNNFLSWLRKFDIKFALGTVSTHSLTILLLDKAGISNFFQEKLIVTYEDIVSPKPSPEVYYETARRMNILSKNQLVFEDSIVGLNAASIAGCRRVALPSIDDPAFLHSLSSIAEAVFHNWEDPKLYSFIKENI